MEFGKLNYFIYILSHYFKFKVGIHKTNALRILMKIIVDTNNKPLNVDTKTIYDKQLNKFLDDLSIFKFGIHRSILTSIIVYLFRTHVFNLSILLKYKKRIIFGFDY